MPVRALLLDFDGVILDSEWPIFEAWQQIYADHGQTLELAVYTACVGADHAAWDPLAELGRRIGAAPDEAALMEQRRAWIDQSLQQAEAMPGVRALLGEARQRGVAVAVASSSSHRWVDGWLEKLGLAEFIQVTVCRDDVERIKPAPDLFLGAARELGVAPEECVVVEDSLNGLRAAMAAGMRCVAVPNRVTNGGDFSAAWRQIDGLGFWDWEGMGAEGDAG